MTSSVGTEGFGLFLERFKFKGCLVNMCYIEVEMSILMYQFIEYHHQCYIIWVFLCISDANEIALFYIILLVLCRNLGENCWLSFSFFVLRHL